MPTPPTSTAPTGFPGRLNGWKEIAAFFGKGVRTVQRWEKELGLPVRRLGGVGRGEIIFAFVAELEAWRAAAEARDDLTARPDEVESNGRPVPGAGRAAPAASLPAASSEAVPSSAAGASSPGAGTSPRTGVPATHRRAFLVAAALLGLAVLGVLAWWALGRRPQQPDEVRVENRVLRVYDRDGRFLWQHRFDFPLADRYPQPGLANPIPSAVVDDIDGDGSREVLFVTNYEPMTVPGGLFCFDSRGKLRFRHIVSRQVAFGDIPCTGPWRPAAIAVAANGDGTKSIWLSSIDRDQFPTVIEKIDPGNRVLAEYWNDGHIQVLMAATFRGRPVMLLGGTDNEFNGASLIVVDRANPTGTTPALRDKYVCRGCPAGRPIELLVLPGSELERVQDNNAGVIEIRRGDRGEFTVVVLHSLGIYREERSSADMIGHTRKEQPSANLIGYTNFTFDADLRPLSGQHQPTFRFLHDEAYRLGALDHPFGPADDARLWPALRWSGSGFAEVRPAPAR